MMTPRRSTVIIVDASVIAAAFFQEEHAEAARALLVAGCKLHAPDLIYSEVANVIWKRHQRSEIDGDEAGQLLGDVMRLPLYITPSDRLVDAALCLAIATGRSVYDCLYLALAVKHKAFMVSADRRLVRSLAGSPLENHVAWIGEYA